MRKGQQKWLLTIVLCTLILTVGSISFVKIVESHRANEQIIETCFEQFAEDGNVVVVKGSIWSGVSCVKE